MEQIELQLGSIHSINSDGTINIRDFRTGGLLYRNIDLEHSAVNVQQPVAGQHVLFMTVPSTFGSSRIVKIIKFYGSQKADTDLVRASPVDMAQGEHKTISQNGNTVYVANGAIYLSGVGQEILLLDSPGLLKLGTTNFQLVVSDGTLIQEKDGKLTISKGELSISDNGAEAKIDKPNLSIVIDKDNVSLEGKTTTVNLNCKNVILGTGAQKALLGEMFKGLYNGHTHPTGVGPSGPPAVQLADTVLTKVTRIG
jgi:hypothetical protein